MIKYTEKTRRILEFIDDYGFITTKICANIFYRDNKAGIDQARHKLGVLVQNGDITSNKRKYSKEIIYQRRKKNVSDHRYLLLNLYSEIYNKANKVEYFKIEEHWDRARKISDGHIIYNNIVDGKEIKRGYLIEIDTHNETEKDKYISLYESNEVQDWYKNKYGDEIFPDVIQVNYNGKAKINTSGFKAIGLDYDFSDFMQKVIL